MSMLHDQLLDFCDTSEQLPHEVQQDLLAAVHAVAEIHYPDLHGDCAECRTPDLNPVRYPCRTVTAVRQQLGLLPAGDAR